MYKYDCNTASPHGCPTADDYEDAREDMQGWTCPQCGRYHPWHHKECWKCHPTGFKKPNDCREGGA